MSANEFTEVPHTIGYEIPQGIYSVLKMITIGWSHLQSVSNKPGFFICMAMDIMDIVRQNICMSELNDANGTKCPG